MSKLSNEEWLAMNTRIGFLERRAEIAEDRVRRATLYLQQNTNIMDIDDLCDHGAESGCCVECSAAGPKAR